jgi:two-component system, NarL family, sensor kinase
MDQKGTTAMIFAIIGLIGLCFIMVFLFIIFQKKKNVLLMKQIKLQQQFEQEIAESQVETKEQTLRNISWELHDNIGQLLTLAKIQLQKISGHSENIKELNDNLSNILSEVRGLSKAINPDFISTIKLEDALKLEIDRLNRLNYVKSSIKIEGKPFEIDSKVEIIIFRIFQEFFSNTIKHSKASKLHLQICFDNPNMTIFAQDNGKGFDTTSVSNGIGLLNMKKRANLINAEVTIESLLKFGTKITVIYKKT